VNKKYRILSFILIIGYVFFFTTKLWNIDDRPRFNSWVSHTIGNNQGRIAITQMVYVSPVDALDIILEQTLFVPHYELVLEAVVHQLDGTSEVVPLTVMNEAGSMNVTRQFLRVYLEDENLDWHFVEIALIDETTGKRPRLTVDWRMVERIDEITTAVSYDLSFDDIVIANNEIRDHTYMHHHTNSHNQNDFEYYESHEPDLSLDGLNRSLDIAFTEYAIVSSLLELNPQDDIVGQSLAFYESEIQRLEALIQAYYDERN